MSHEPSWHEAKRIRCSQCGGKGHYRDYLYRLVDPCPRCGGSGKVIPR